MFDPKILLDFPTRFEDINYPTKNVNYYNENEESRSLFESLLESSNHRCMYCGTDLSGEKTYGIDGDYQKEHTIEKSQYSGDGSNFLERCKFNFSVACNKCNNYKKYKVKCIGKEFSKLDYNYCTDENCLSHCFEIEKALNEYLNINNIIIQPYGTYHIQTGFPLEIQYDVLKKRFIPSEKFKYFKETKESIKKHIEKFKLNKRNLKILDQIITDLYNDMKQNKEFRIFTKKSLLNPNNNSHSNVLDDMFIDYLNNLSERQKRMTVRRIFREYILMNN